MKFTIALVAAMSLSAPVCAADMPLAPMALNSLSRAPANIASAPVMNQSGTVIGKVQRVVNDQYGKPAAVSYTTTDGKLVVIAAPAVSYDGQRHLLVTADSPQRMASR